MPTPTASSYAALSRAYEHFNRRLFNGKLPTCLITLQRHKGAYGYFHAKRFSDLDKPDKAPDLDEIALNPAGFPGRSATEILSTLAHEMCHLWQEHFGKPSRGGYHNHQWAQKMVEIGLAPSDTGQPGGKATGPKVSHYVERDGAFARATKDFLLGESMPLWGDPNVDDPTARKKRESKTKYTCPECGTNAWAKPNTNLICGDCDEHLLTAEELPEAE